MPPCKPTTRNRRPPIRPAPAVPAAEPFRCADGADVGEMCGKDSASSSKKAGRRRSVRICSEHIQKQGWTVAARYEDQGISGAALGNRPGELKLQERALARRFDVIGATDLTRLPRSQGDLSK